MEKSYLAKVKHKGQVTIPAEVSEELGIEEGSLLELRVANRSIHLKAMSPLEPGEGRWEGRIQQGHSRAWRAEAELALTSVADTRLLMACECPPDQASRGHIRVFLRRELSSRLLVPSVVLSEFIKIAGSKMGEEGAKVRISQLKERRARVVPVEEWHDLEAGKLLLANHEASMADALIASFVLSGDADYIISDDPHYRALGAKSKWFQ